MSLAISYPISENVMICCTQFCGDTVAVVSLLSDCVARFRLDADREVTVDVLIPRLSLYIMRYFEKSLQFKICCTTFSVFG